MAFNARCLVQEMQIYYPQDKWFHDLFEAQARSRPDAAAVAYGDNMLSYEELNRDANQLASYLQGIGIGPEVLVGILMEPSFDLMISLIGVLKAGGAYVPLDPTYPQERVAFMEQDADIYVLLTHKCLASMFPTSTIPITISLDLEWPAIRQKSDGEKCPISRVRGENLAYVIYTSGSTGRPKGTQITHLGLLNYTTAIHKAFKHRPADRMLQLASISFDVAVEEIFPTWLSGATVVLCNRQLLASPRELRKAIEQEQLTVFVLLTAYWHEWVRELIHAGDSIPKCVRQTIIGGDRVLPQLLLEWSKFNVPLVNVYGLTEVTVTSTVYEVTKEDFETQTEIPIGRPIAHTSLYALDPDMQPVPIGAPGELYIGGIGLARGYLNRAKLTAEKFVPDPFSKESGVRLYRTGDMVRYRDDGNIEFLGRIDTQVKLRGYRIELGEIEIALSNHPQIQQCVAIVREDDLGDKRLVAYIVVKKQEQTPSVGDLRRFLQNLLPDYMLPSTFVVLEKLPLTPNAKIDHSALPKPSIANIVDFDKPFVAPRSPVEEILTLIYGEVIGIEQISIYDNFFELGGDSLLALTIISQIQDMLGVEVLLQAFFEKSTVADVAEYIVELGEANAQDITKVAQIIIRLTQLSDDEVTMALEERGKREV